MNEMQELVELMNVITQLDRLRLTAIKLVRHRRSMIHLREQVEHRRQAVAKWRGMRQPLTNR